MVHLRGCWCRWLRQTRRLTPWLLDALGNWNSQCHSLLHKYGKVTQSQLPRRIPQVSLPVFVLFCRAMNSISLLQTGGLWTNFWLTLILASCSCCMLRPACSGPPSGKTKKPEKKKQENETVTVWFLEQTFLAEEKNLDAFEQMELQRSEKSMTSFRCSISKLCRQREARQRIVVT